MEVSWCLRQNEDLGSILAGHLHLLGKDVITVQPGREFRQTSDKCYEIDVIDPGHYVLLFAALRDSAKTSGDCDTHLERGWGFAPAIASQGTS